MAGFVERMLGAARLDPATYEEVEADTSATMQAALVVVISSVCIALGALRSHPGGLIGVTLLRLAGWYVWALVTYLVGTRVLPGPRTEADVGQMLRTLGFASTPGIAGILAGLPGVGGVVALVVTIWMIAAMVVAVRQALDYEDTGRAVGVVLIGFLAYLLVSFAVAGLLVGTAREAG
jgi:hypothetical protein